MRPMLREQRKDIIMKKNKKLFTAILMLILVFSVQCTVFADTSSNGTFDLNSGESWDHTTASGTRLKDKKETDDITVEVYTISKTMMSCPTFRMVNNKKEARSASITTSETGKSTTSESNTGTNGYNYYAAVKAAWNQITNNQSIRIKFDSY